MTNARWFYRANISKATLGNTIHSLVSLSEPHFWAMHRCKFHIRNSRTSVPSSRCSIPTFRCSVPGIKCSIPNRRQLNQLCSSPGRVYNRFLIRQPCTSRMLSLKEIKLLVCVSSVDCQATWLKIVLPTTESRSQSTAAFVRAVEFYLW
jgi:hypothetical protein